MTPSTTLATADADATRSSGSNTLLPSSAAFEIAGSSGTLPKNGTLICAHMASARGRVCGRESPMADCGNRAEAAWCVRVRGDEVAHGAHEVCGLAENVRRTR